MFLKLNMNYNTFINKYKNVVSCVYKFIRLVWLTSVNK